MYIVSVKLSAFLLLSALTITPAFAAAPLDSLQPFLKKYCFECHDADMSKGGLDLTALELKDDRAIHARWVAVFDRIKSGEMPPPKQPRPQLAEQQPFLTTLGSVLTRQHQAMKGTVLRRLNRIEYENTLNDMLGTRINLSEMLPVDSIAHGFDNQGDALTMSDVQMRQYLDAATKALSAATTPETRPETKKVRYTYADPLFERSLTPDLNSGGGKWLQRPDGAVVFFTRGYPNTALRTFIAWGDGRYTVKIGGYAYQSAKPVTFALQVGNSSGLFFSTRGIQTQGYYTLPPEDSAEPKIVETSNWFARGESLRISPDGLGLKPGSPGLHNLKGGVAAYQGSGLAIQYVDVEGPFLEEWPRRGYTLLFGDLPLKPRAAPPAKSKRNAKPASTHEVVSTNPSADAKKLLTGFVTRAYRRPVTAERVEPFIALFEAELKLGASFEDAMRTAATAVLCSPGFLYLRESPAGPLDNSALAARLSYFLTRAMPDDELLRLAAAGTLKQPATLRAQTERLLSHPDAQRFVADFTDGWLDLRNIEFTTPDKQIYPEFDDHLQDSLVLETRAFVAKLFQDNLTVSNIVQSDFAMLNARLAKHYAIPGVAHLDIKPVKLPPDSKRGGILTQASILKVSANGTTTSPVIRGVWVMDRILGVKLPPPPPGTPGVEPDIRGATTMREMLAKHSTLESCNSCHRVIDPPGFALESYDVIGGWRERFRSLGEGDPVKTDVDGKRVRYKLAKPVDASGQLYNGPKFNDFSEFQKLLLKNQNQLVRALAEKLLIFSTGRELGFSDRTELDQITEKVKTKGGGMRELLHSIVQSEIFLTK